MNLLLIGAIVMAYFTASLFFLRFWSTTRDRFFLFFAISFIIEGCGRLALGLSYSDEQQPIIYLIRLISFLVIIFAILDKNGIRKR